MNKMLKFTHFVTAYCYSSSAHKIVASLEVTDVKNSHLIYVKDSTTQLPYLSEIETEDGQKGIVIKLQQKSTTVIGLYDNANINTKLNITKILPSQSQINSFKLSLNTVYNNKLQPTAMIKDIEPSLAWKCNLQKQNKNFRIPTQSQLLTLCHDIFVGDFRTFSGSLGSGRTTNALQTMECFTNSNIEEPIGIYLNANHNDSYQTCTQAAKIFRSSSFGRFSLPNPRLPKIQTGKLSSVGVYMLAVNVIRLANKLKKEGKNVLLIVDNIQQILANEWTILQNLKLPLSSFSILNELYSSCSVHQSLTNQKPGSLTTIAITSSEDQDALQEYSTLGNNNKHLRTLTKPIQFPLNLTINSNKVHYKGVAKLRQKINRLIREKKQKDLLTKLKLAKDEPWEHYFILDSEWWTTALRKYQPKSRGDELLLIWFINLNIEEDYCANWKINCLQAYNRYLDFLARPEDPRIGIDKSQFQNFLQICKAQGLFDVFKRDYLN